MFLKGNELFLIVDTLWDSPISWFNTKEEAENELKMIQENMKGNKLIEGFKIKHFKEAK